ncbi:MAG: hypothetical protein JWQ43_2345 [Glaciihabitans sp.]|nr:hypothetical protein [Glaciihabitans sp.]
MADTLQVNADALRTAAQTFSTQADAVPTQVALDMGNCGSSSVAAAAENFNMWARVAGQIAAAKLRDVALGASSTATNFDGVDTDLAGNIAGK